MRTGTTLLRALLGQHPNVFGGLETHWFGPDFTAAYADPQSTTGERLRIFFDLDLDTYRRLAEVPTPEAFLNGLMDACTKRANKHRWVEKSPDNVLHLARIREHWPKAYFIHCVRDPRDVYASWKRDNKRSLDAYLENALQALQEVRQAQGEMPTMTVRYDHLVQDPRSTMTAVCDFIGEDFVPGMEVNSSGRADFNRVKAATGKESTVLQSLARPVFTNSVGQYEKLLDGREVAAIEATLAPYFDAFLPDLAPAQGENFRAQPPASTYSSPA